MELVCGGLLRGMLSYNMGQKKENNKSIKYV